MNIDITPFFPDFKEHLDQNARIVFSGPFGSGKTHFIKEFFKDNEDYEAFHLFPVNYSVASNEDIFELIKYDILYELSNRVTNWKNDSQLSWYLDEEFLKDHKINFFQPAIEAIPKIGKPTIQMLKGLKKIKDKYLSFIKKKNATNELKELISFAESMDQNIGSIYEADFYSNLIRDLVERVSQNGDKKKPSILILDDLDRLDPEHIFRILNVISAHIDEDSNTNKFGFDHIIIVSHESNIKYIFEHRYGSNVDFTGYFSKFLSTKTYSFDIKAKVSDRVDTFLESIESISSMSTERVRNSEYYNLTNKNSEISNAINNLLTCFILQGQVHIRDLIKLERKTFNQPKYVIYPSMNRTVYSNIHYHVFFLIDFFVWFFGDIDKLKNRLSKINLPSIEYDSYTSTEFFVSVILDVRMIYNQLAGGMTHTQAIGSHSVSFAVRNDPEMRRSMCKLDDIKNEKKPEPNLSAFLHDCIEDWQSSGVRFN